MDIEDICLAFSRKRRRRAIATTITVVLILVLLPMIAPKLGANLALVLFVVILSAFTAFVWKDWRCPACEKALGRDFSYTCCPNCGRRLSA